MRLLHRYPAVVTRSIDVAPRDAGMFGDRVEAYEALGSPRRYRVTVNAVMLDGLRLVALEATGHRATFLDMDTFGLIVAERGSLFTQDAGATVEVRGDVGVLRGPGRRTTTIPGPYLGLGLRVPLSRLAAHAARNGADGWRSCDGWPIRPSLRLVRSLRYVVRELDAEDAVAPTPSTARGMAQLLLDLLVEDCTAVAAAARPVSLAGLAQVRIAEEALRARACDPVSIIALAGELGIGTRSLQMGFRRHRGTTPRAFLAACRFEAARERLARAAPGETVAAIAFECGVTHLGRFAGGYRARYGEAPSATLARAQRKA